MKNLSIKKLFKFVIFALCLTLIGTSFAFALGIDDIADKWPSPTFTDLTLQNDLKIYGNIIDGGGVDDDDIIEVATGTLYVKGKLLVEKVASFYGGLTVDGNINVDRNGIFNIGDLSFMDTPTVNITKGLGKGNVIINGVTVDGELLVDKGIYQNGGDTVLINDNLQADGDIISPGGNIIAEQGTLEAQNLELAQDAEIDGELHVGETISNHTSDTVTVKNNLNVENTITAKVIGNSYIGKSDIYTIKPLSLGEGSYTCPSGFAQSCHIEPCKIERKLFVEQIIESNLASFAIFLKTQIDKFDIKLSNNDDCEVCEIPPSEAITTTTAEVTAEMAAPAEAIEFSNTNNAARIELEPSNLAAPAETITTTTAEVISSAEMAAPAEEIEFSNTNNAANQPTPEEELKAGLAELKGIEKTLLGKLIIFFLTADESIQSNTPCLSGNLFEYIGEKTGNLKSFKSNPVFIVSGLAELALIALELIESAETDYWESRYLHSMYATPIYDEGVIACEGGAYNSSHFLEIGFNITAVCFDPSTAT